MQLFYLENDLFGELSHLILWGEGGSVFSYLQLEVNLGNI